MAKKRMTDVERVDKCLDYIEMPQFSTWRRKAILQLLKRVRKDERERAIEEKRVVETNTDIVHEEKLKEIKFENSQMSLYRKLLIRLLDSKDPIHKDEEWRAEYRKYLIKEEKDER